MGALESLPELVAAARANAKPFEERLALGADTTDAALSYDKASRGLEAASVEVYSLFEARMQHHFKRGPFSRKLKALLLEAGEAELAERVHQFYLCANVLKPGAPDDQALVDVSGAGFFKALTGTILDAYDFLEK